MAGLSFELAVLSPLVLPRDVCRWLPVSFSFYRANEMSKKDDFFGDLDADFDLGEDDGDVDVHLDLNEDDLLMELDEMIND